VRKRRRKLGGPIAAGIAALLCAVLVAACGGSDDDGAASGGGTAAPGTIPALSEEPITLTFLWFEWPPAQALEDFANSEYKKLRPNVTVKVNTVPIANWHDAIFTQFAARKTDFDIPVLDSQYIGEAVENGNILDLTDFANENIDKDAYDPYLLAAYGQYPQAKTGELDPDARLYGLPLLGDTWAMMWRKDLMGDEPPKTWDEMIAAAQKCQDENPGMSGLAFHQSKDADAAAVTYNTVNGVYGGELLSAASLAAMTKVDRIGYEREYGLGTLVHQPDLRTTVVGHTGGMIGYATVVWYAPEHDLAIAVLVNASEGEPEDLAQLLMREILRAEGFTS
jgi:multiple sugar transport system substrate-binding protein